MGSEVDQVGGPRRERILSISGLSKGDDTVESWESIELLHRLEHRGWTTMRRTR